jgi:EAL domain-containing protein (putative c-di-GMP-specific phosphodiesterase class I)
MASSLELKVVAEGVETAPQLELVQSLGCDAGQGYAFAHPMPLDALKAWLRARRASKPRRARAKSARASASPPKSP